MKQKFLKNCLPVSQNNFARQQEDKAYGKSLLKSCQAKILKMISDLSLRNESQYRDLFYFEDDKEPFKNLEKRFIFILLQIFRNDIIDKNDHNLQIFISPRYNQSQKYINYHEKNYFFYTHIKVIMIFKKNLIQEFNTIFFWTNKLLLDEYTNFKTFNIVDFAIKKISQINHTMFLRIKNAKKYHFFNYLQGVVESISSKFSIIWNNHIDSEDLLRNSQIFIEINYENVLAFAANFSQNETTISKFDEKTQRDFEQKYLVSQMPSINFFSKETVIKIWKKIAQILRTDFKDFWTKQDKLYVLVRTVKHLFSYEKNQMIGNFLSITTSQKSDSNFLIIYKITNFAHEKQEGLNFLWFFNAHNFKFQVSNFTYATVKILEKNIAIVQKILNDLENFTKDLKNISSNRFHLENNINSIINATFCDFKTRYIYSGTHTICEISIEKNLAANFTINWLTKRTSSEILI